jgi:two-component system chemotaxis response regulator CheB
VGHAYAPESLLTAQRDTTEAALWAALRALEEKSLMAERLTRRAREVGAQDIAVRYEREAETAQADAELLRQLLLGTEAAAN